MKIIFIVFVALFLSCSMVAPGTGPEPMQPQSYTIPDSVMVEGNFDTTTYSFDMRRYYLHWKPNRAAAAILFIAGHPLSGWNQYTDFGDEFAVNFNLDVGRLSATAPNNIFQSMHWRYRIVFIY